MSTTTIIIIIVLLLILIILGIFLYYFFLPGAEPEEEEETEREPSRYFPGLGIGGDPSTSFATGNVDDQLTPDEIRSKCDLFGKNCYAFDTIGTLLLKRDEGDAEVMKLKPEFEKKHGLIVTPYVPEATMAKICDLSPDHERCKKKEEV